MIVKLIHYLRAINYNKFDKVFLLCSLSLLISTLELLNVGFIFPILQSFLDPVGFENNFLIKKISYLFSIKEILNLTIFVIVSFLIITIMRSIITYISYKKIIRQIARDESQFATKQYFRLIHYDFLFFQSNPSSKLIRDIAISIPLGYSTALQSLMILLTEGVIFLGLGFYLFLLNPVVFLVVIATFVIAGVFYLRFISPKLSSLGAERHDISHKTIGVLQQSIEGISQIKNWNSEAFFEKKFSQIRSRQAFITASLNVMQNFPKIYFETIIMFCMCGFLSYAIFMSGNSKEMLSVTGFYIVASMRILPSILRVSAQYNNLVSVEPAMNLVLQEQNQSDWKYEQLNKKDCHLPTFNSKISFEKIRFYYEKDFVIKDLSFDILKGDFIGIFGRSGQGKTTLVNLLVGLLKPSEGVIKIDQEEFKEKDSSRNLLSLIGYVPQNVFLIDDTIRRNIAFGQEDDLIDDQKVYWALEQAQLTDFVEALSNGIDTVVGERGARISGGQRQRIGIARAFYFDREFLVFDEATSSLDEQTEKNLCDTIELFKGRKTVLFISHRPTPLSICSQVFEMKSGVLEIKKI